MREFFIDTLTYIMIKLKSQYEYLKYMYKLGLKK